MTSEFAPAFGWVDDREARAEAVASIARRQASPALFAATEAARDAVDPDTSVLLWLAEDKVRGTRRPTWDQRQVGSCVSFGWGRACNDTIMGMAARGEIDAPPEDVATEPIYGGSRVEVGGGRISGDGSVGAWAAKWVSERGGLLLRKKYGAYDLSQYSESVCRDWGSRGVPDELEPIARLTVVKSVALVQTAQGAWDALGSGYAVPVCSGVGFTESLSDGFLRASGSWGHCMEIRGRALARRGGQAVKAFAIQNSWYAGWLKGDHAFTDAKTGERVEMPEGVFLADWDAVNRMLSEQDSFAVSDLEGFPKRDALSWLM